MMLRKVRFFNSPFAKVTVMKKKSRLLDLVIREFSTNSAVSEFKVAIVRVFAVSPR